MTIVAACEIEHTQFLDPQGEAVKPLPPFAADAAALVAMYRAMVLTRAFDAKAIAMQRTGKIGTFASALGQEAVGVGVASAMRPEDVLVPSYRDHPAQFLRGVTMTESLLYWGGDERGSGFAGPRHDFANCVPIATQVCHAGDEALAKARAGGGPTLIEALTYRLGDHTTADDATRYRDAETVRQQWQFEPIVRLRNYLARSGAWDKDKEETLQRECAEQV